MPTASSVWADQPGQGDQSARLDARGFIGSHKRTQMGRVIANARIGRQRVAGAIGLSKDSTSRFARRPSNEESPKKPTPAGNRAGSFNRSSINRSRLRK